MLKQCLPYIMLTFILALAVYLAGIAYEKKPPSIPGAKYYTVRFDNGIVLRTEVAETKEELKTGLMFRKELAKNNGMLFIFGMEFKYSIWMRNTLIPLDVIWINERMEIVDIVVDVPPCKTEKCPTYSPEFPAKYIIEAPAKWTVWNKIYPSMKVKIFREDGAQL